MARGKKAKFTETLTIHITPEMHQYLDLLAKRKQTPINEVVRQAIRDYLDQQDDVIGSRSRIGSRVTRQLETMQHRLVDQVSHMSVVLLAAIILKEMEQGARGSAVLDRVARLVEQAGEQFQGVLDKEPVAKP